MIRSDAVRNRTKVLEAAEAVLGEQGLSARMDEIARRAGVGVGTLYRHFATKEALYQAIVTARTDLLLAEAQRLISDAAPETALYVFFARIVADAGRKKPLTDALHTAGIDIKAAQTGQAAQMRAAIHRLLHDAQHAGAVRRDLDLPELLALLRAACLAAETGDYPEPVVERMLTVLFDGLGRVP
ncbi:putative transcriptional regulatory protein TetR [Catellatospora sp. TT07R-123]|uniref:TetR/AcrR family transcriptional regulator n=1 Tax=Catellatospora sp. TT07R-123 TaxID=2733863 RepID=UPI001B2B17FC|nr:TetR/AcrR family transcriptional regulator [Catellatospora sp. TT07R-123]GHJ43583.1 putative transcriptional regulatory protein TetR [Catellatospora sp. TT07R-123]